MKRLHAIIVVVEALTSTICPAKVLSVTAKLVMFTGLWCLLNLSIQAELLVRNLAPQGEHDWDGAIGWSHGREWMANRFRIDLAGMPNGTPVEVKNISLWSPRGTVRWQILDSLTKPESIVAEGNARSLDATVATIPFSFVNHGGIQGTFYMVSIDIQPVTLLTGMDYYLAVSASYSWLSRGNQPHSGQFYKLEGSDNWIETGRAGGGFLFTMDSRWFITSPPRATEEEFTIDEDETLTFQLTRSGKPAQLTFFLVERPSLGTVSLQPDGLFVYIPHADVFGADSFTFKVSDGEQESMPAKVSIQILPINDRPVAEIQIEPLLDLGQDPSVLTILSPNNIDAFVRLDGTLSSDPEGDPLTFVWLDKAPWNVLGYGAEAIIVAGIGEYTVLLIVDDGQNTASAVATFRIITAVQAVEMLVQQVRGLALAQNRERPLIAILTSIAASFDRGHFSAGLNGLKAFQNKARAQVGHVDAQLAEDLIGAAQEIIDALLAEPEPEPERGPIDNMVWIEPGTFLMGSPETEVERGDNETQHEVTITRGFWMGQYEVTQAEYVEVMGNNPSRYSGINLPVEGMSWFDAVNYCDLLTERERMAGRLPEGFAYRLPTEAEWEYACRGGTTTSHHYRDELRSGIANFDGFREYSASLGTIDNPEGVYLQHTGAVGSYEPNAWGLYDMHGNVQEWCWDRYTPSYPTGSVADPVGPETGRSIVVRGGSWANSGRDCRSAARDNANPLIGFNSPSEPGFRVVLGRPYPLE